MQPYVPNVRRSSLVSRVLKSLALLVVIAVLAWHVVEGWMIASWIGDEYLLAGPPAPAQDAAVIGIDSDRITLRRSPAADIDAATPGVFGFAADHFYLRLGEVVEVGGEDVVRTFEAVQGVEPVIGEFGDLDLVSRPSSVLDAMGLHETTYTGPLGEMDALAMDGSDTWVIHVHDRLATAEQALPMMALLSDTGVSQLSITYRNDPGQPAGDSARFSFGVAERDDLAAAIARARSSGADEVVLVGYGTGGSVVLAEMYRDLDVAGAILDSPVLDAEAAAIDAVESQREGVLGFLPPTIVRLGAVLAAVRYGVDWQSSDYLSRAAQLRSPVLVLHATADGQHPIEQSRQLAADRPDEVRLVEIEDAGTGLAWNTDPARYEAEVLEFVRGLD